MSREQIAYLQSVIDKVITQVLVLAKGHQKGRVMPDITNVIFDFTEGWFRNCGMWLACHTDTEISEATGLSSAAMTKITSDFTLGKLSKSEITPAEHAVGLDPTDHALRVSGKTENFPNYQKPAAEHEDIRHVERSLSEKGKLSKIRPTRRGGGGSFG